MAWPTADITGTIFTESDFGHQLGLKWLHAFFHALNERQSLRGETLTGFRNQAGTIITSPSLEDMSGINPLGTNTGSVKDNIARLRTGIESLMTGQSIGNTQRMWTDNLTTTLLSTKNNLLDLTLASDWVTYTNVQNTSMWLQLKQCFDILKYPVFFPTVNYGTILYSGDQYEAASSFPTVYTTSQDAWDARNNIHTTITSSLLSASDVLFVQHSIVGFVDTYNAGYVVIDNVDCFEINTSHLYGTLIKTVKSYKKDPFASNLIFAHTFSDGVESFSTNDLPIQSVVTDWPTIDGSIVKVPIHITLTNSVPIFNFGSFNIDIDNSLNLSTGFRIHTDISSSLTYG